MNVQVAVLADHANVAAGDKLNILGVFDTIGASKFPTLHPFMVLAMRFRFDYTDGGTKNKLRIALIDEDGNELIRAEAEIGLKKIPPGGVRHANHIINFAGMQFMKTGQYAFHILWNGEEKARVDLLLVKRTPGQKPSGPK